jgi:sec-independent protein translocase protein TatA
MFGMGPVELLVVLALLVMFFGRRRLPQIGENLGKSIREFRRAFKPVHDGDRSERAGGGQEPVEPSGQLTRSGPPDQE